MIEKHVYEKFHEMPLLVYNHLIFHPIYTLFKDINIKHGLFEQHWKRISKDFKYISYGIT